MALNLNFFKKILLVIVLPSSLAAEEIRKDFVVRIGVFKEIKNVKNLMKKIKKNNLSATYETLEKKDGRRLYSIQKRSLANLSEAKKMAQKILNVLGEDVSRLYVTKNKKILAWVSNEKEGRRTSSEKVERGKKKKEKLSFASQWKS